MSDALRKEYLSHRDNFDALDAYVKDMCANGSIEDAERCIIDAQSSFAIPPSIPIFFSEHRLSEKIINNAARDFPVSLPVFKLRLLLPNSDKSKLFEEFSTTIGVFNAEFWDMYRNEFPDKNSKIWEMEFANLVNGISEVTTLYELEGDSPPPDLSPRQNELDTLLTVYKNDFTNIRTCFGLLSHEESALNYEQCINFHPYNATLWLKYLQWAKNPEELSERSIRYCFKSGRIWSLRLDHSTDIDMERIKYLDSPIDAKLILGRLCSMDKENTEMYVNAFLGMDVFQKTDAFVFASILLDDFYANSGNNEQRAVVLKQMTDKYPNRSDLWLRRIDFYQKQTKTDEKAIKATRNIYKEAIKALSVDKMYVVDAWMAFEATISDDYSEIISFVAEEDEEGEKTKGKETEKKFEEKTIFVSNFGLNMTKDVLVEMFEQFGVIKRISLKAKFAFIEFEEASSAEAAIKEMNGKPYKEFHLKVQPHVNKEKHTLFIKFDPYANQEALISFLKQKSGVDKITYRFAKNSRADAEASGTEIKGHGFLDVTTAADAANLMALSRKELFNGKQIIIEMARNEKKEAHEIKVKKEKKETRDDLLRKYFGFF